MKRKEIRHNRPKIEHLGGHLLHIFQGKDATQLPGITDYTWLQIFAASGPDLSKWATEKHFTSWLGLAPGQHQSGKMKKSRSRKSHPTAGQIFRTIAQGLLESKQIALGAFGRKLRNKKGAAIAIKAVARKLAILYWRLMIHGSHYIEQGIMAYEEKLILQKEKWVRKNALELGMQLSHIQ